MNKNLCALLIIVIILPLAGCASPTPALTPTSLPTNTPIPIPTVTPVPTPTLEPTREVSPETIAEIDELLTKMNKDLKLLNGVVLVAKDGKILLNKAYGLADREKNIPLEPDTLMPTYIAGMIESALLLLVDQGKLSLESPVCSYITSCPEIWDEISISDVLYHESGIPDPLEGMSDQAQKDIWDSPTVFEDLIVLLQEKPLLPIPEGGTSVSSWFNDMIKIKIIETITGDTLANFYRKNFLEPLGVTYLGKDFTPADVPPGYTTYGNLTHESLPESLVFPDMVISTTEDLFLAYQEYLKPTILSENALDTLQREMVWKWRDGKVSKSNILGITEWAYFDYLLDRGYWNVWDFAWGYSGIHLISPQDQVIILIFSNEKGRDFTMITKIIHQRITGKE